MRKDTESVLNRLANPRAVAVITRLACIVSIAFIAVLLIVMTGVLGHALGGSLFAYVARAGPGRGVVHPGAVCACTLQPAYA